MGLRLVIDNSMLFLIEASFCISEKVKSYKAQINTACGRNCILHKLYVLQSLNNDASLFDKSNQYIFFLRQKRCSRMQLVLYDAVFTKWHRV